MSEEQKLSDWAKSQSDYISIKDGETLECIYQGHKYVPSRFDPEKVVPRYSLEIEDGVVKKMDCGNTFLAFGLDGIEPGTKIKISRTGEKKDTKYVVERL